MPSGYTQLTATVSNLDADAIEALSDGLMDVGALSVDFADALEGTPEESPMFDEPDAASSDISKLGTQSAAGWSQLRLNALFTQGVDALGLLASVCQTIELAVPADAAVSHLAEEDWVRLTQAQFNPIEITPHLWIVPTWHEAVSAANVINIRLDPGVAFGTGNHPTTHLCLRWLSGLQLSNKAVLDYGCGSGILAIAASKLGAASIVGVDIDPQAVEAAKYNAQLNEVAGEFYTTEVPVKAAPIVVANILAKPLMVLAPFLAEHTQPGGQIALAGLLNDQAEEVADAYRTWFDIGAHDRKDGWTLLVGRKR
jgi:ribosomal protein L11 methyltransferase